MRSQARSEHARPPRPPRFHELWRRALGLGLRHGVDVLDNMHGLLLSRVRNLGNGWHDSEVAVAHREDDAFAPRQSYVLCGRSTPSGKLSLCQNSLEFLSYFTPHTCLIPLSFM